MHSCQLQLEILLEITLLLSLISLARKRDVINISKLMSFSMSMQTEELIGEGLF